ncbi:hypothetical protein KUW04_15780 [Halomonas denitrificans]|nr:hypothetical protein [Halomonas denitrificans]
MRTTLFIVLGTLLLGACSSNRSQLPGYEPQVIDSLSELDRITERYAVPLSRFESEPSRTNFSRQFPGHHRLPNQSDRVRYQLYLDQRYVLKRDDEIVDTANILILLYKLFADREYDNVDSLETSPRLYRQYLTFEWQGERYLGYQLAERHCTSDRTHPMNCEF